MSDEPEEVEEIEDDGDEAPWLAHLLFGDDNYREEARRSYALALAIGFLPGSKIPEVLTAANLFDRFLRGESFDFPDPKLKMVRGGKE